MFLKRVPFQLSVNFTGAIHSTITFGNKAGILGLDFFKFVDFSFVVGVPHCGSIFKVWPNKTEIECLLKLFMLVPIVKFRLIIRIDFERVFAGCSSHENELSSSTPRYGWCSTSDRSSPSM